MASIYKPKDKKYWYISFVDPDSGKVRNRSTGLEATKKNLKKAQEIVNEIEEVIKNQKDLYTNNNIKRASIADAFKRFLNLNSDKHEKTIGDYERFLKLFSQSYDISLPCTVLDKLSAEEWIIKIKSLDKAKNTIYNYFKVFNKFLNFLFEYSYVPVFKINKNLKPKPEIKEIVVFKKEHIKKIMKGLEKKNSNFRTIMLLMIYTGLRPSDILKAKVEDIDIEDMMLKYYSTKSKRYLRVPLHDDLEESLLKRIDEVRTGRIFNYSTIGEIGKAFRRFLDDLELKGKGYNLRTFRKHFATLAYESDVSLMSAAKLLGHKNISTTMKYYTNANQKKLSKDVNKLKFMAEEEIKKGVKRE
jgi:integrase